MSLRHILVVGAAFAFAAMVAGHPARSPELLKQAQERLSALGHYSGTVDGIMNAKTQGALRAFQRSKGLRASGQLDEPTVAALGIGRGQDPAAGGSSSEPPRQRH